MARGETGGLLALAYSSMRGYGSVHPTIGELRVGWQQVRIAHPFRQGETISIGEVRITEAELICGASKTDGDGPRYTIGYGACFGVNENKAISMATFGPGYAVGRCRRSGPGPSEFALPYRRH